MENNNNTNNNNNNTHTESFWVAVQSSKNKSIIIMKIYEAWTFNIHQSSAHWTGKQEINVQVEKKTTTTITGQSQ